MFHLSPFPTRSASAAIKLEVEDSAVDQFGPLAKKPRPSGPPQQAYYNSLNEPSPLGLRLRKSSSLLELIQMKLEKETSVPTCHTGSDHSGTGKFKDANSAAYSGTTDKLKASNFPASLLRIGTWECVSRYEGDLVAKCYFAKHKLVWEVLNDCLKSKIEIQWSDITALKAFCPENKPGTLEIVLARQPLFFKETNPQPRKHTLWQATSDFTSGQANIHRKHFLQCPPGLLNKHFEKLIQCDPCLYTLSQKPDIPLDFPYFEHRSLAFDDQEETKSSVFNPIGECGPSFSGFQDVASGCSTSPCSSRSDIRDAIGRIRDSACREIPSPSTVMDVNPIKEMDKIEAEDIKDHPDSVYQFKVPGLHQSISMSDLVKHIGNHISGQGTSGTPPFCSTEFSTIENKDMLDEITQYLLSDSQLSAASDENSLMSKVNSLCCLLQQDPSKLNSRVHGCQHK